MSAARAFARTKPIVAYKAGRFAESAQAAASHTGAMAGVDAVYEAAFQRAGIVRIFESDDMFDCAELLVQAASAQGRPAGDHHERRRAGRDDHRRADRPGRQNGRRSPRRPSSKLNETLPPFWSHNNPVDVLGDAPPERFAKALEIVLQDKGVDAVLVILTPQAMTDATATAARGRRGRGQGPQAGPGHVDGRAHGQRRDRRCSTRRAFATYTTPEKAVRAFMHLVSYARNLEILHDHAARHSAGVQDGSAAAPRRVRHDSDRGERDPFGEHVEGVPRSLRDSGHQAASGPIGRRGGRRGPAAAAIRSC